MLNQHSDMLKVQHKNFNKDFQHKYKMYFTVRHLHLAFASCILYMLRSCG